MSDNLNKCIESSHMMIDVAYAMIQSCQLKKKKVFSESRFVVSFFLRRAIEIVESFLVLIKENRIIDSAVLLRSLLEMGINVGYIFAKEIDDKEKEIRASKYLMEGNWKQLKLTESNLEGFREFSSNIEERRDELKVQIAELENMFKKRFTLRKWKRLPTILQRAEISEYEVLKSAYNQSYLDLSSIEHHNILFGQHYVNGNECEPLNEIDHIKHFSQFRPIVSLFLVRMIFIEIMNSFYQEFQLNYKNKMENIRKIQDEEYKLLGDE